ncbi:MAG TPA: 3-hydroxyacyl-[acyl-carrier-protein] dehydratase FabZ [Casimicrobiaceae bacterium]|nr:3-hydroxyacyl-[acyl-carrier-protein] dehydratase FabZ [Casimicrobiaceae bacterium]
MALSEPVRGTGAMDIQEVSRMLMHRFPFLLVDRVVDCVAGEYIVGIKNISRHEPILGGSCRSFPNLLLIEALAQVSVILTYKTLAIDPTGQELMFFAGIDDATISGFARGGDRVMLRSSVHRLRRKLGWFRAEASVEGRQIAAMTMLAAIHLPDPATLVG